MTTSAQRVRQTLSLPGYENVVEPPAAGLVLQDRYIVVQGANRLAEAESVTNEDPKSAGILVRSLA